MLPRPSQCCRGDGDDDDDDDYVEPDIKDRYTNVKPYVNKCKWMMGEKKA